MNTYFNNKANAPLEILDLVNQNDEIIGEVVREDANSNPKLFHREVAIVLVDNQSRILLQKRSKYKTINPGMWSITAGHVIKGKDLLVTAHQELREELGIDTELIFIRKVLQKYAWESHFMNYFLGKYNNEEIKIEETEVEEIRFFSKKELDKFISEGGNVNLKHMKIFNDYWEGKFKGIKL